MVTAPQYDVAVVGLGAMGAACLYQLARLGARAIGIDRLAPPHDEGSSHGQTRITRAAVGEGAAYVPLVVATHRIWRELEAESGREIFVDCGALILASRIAQAAVHGQPDFLGATASLAARFGIAHEMLEGAEVGRRFPRFTGLHETHAYWEPGGGYVRPEAAITAQLEAAARRGAAIRTGAAATAIEQTERGVAVATADGPIAADRVVVAAGGWCGPLLGAPFDRRLAIQRQVFHWFPLAQDDRGGERDPVFIWLHGGSAPGHFYGFPPLDGERAVKLATEHEATVPSLAAIRREVGEREADDLFRGHVAGRLRGVAPQAVRSTVCFYTVTPDHGFIIDRHPAMERVTVIAACSGHGFKHSAGIGRAVAERLARGASSIDLAPFALARFES